MEWRLEELALALLVSRSAITKQVTPNDPCNKNAAECAGYPAQHHLRRKVCANVNARQTGEECDERPRKTPLPSELKPEDNRDSSHVRRVRAECAGTGEQIAKYAHVIENCSRARRKVEPLRKIADFVGQNNRNDRSKNCDARRASIEQQEKSKRGKRNSQEPAFDAEAEKPKDRIERRRCPAAIDPMKQSNVPTAQHRAYRSPICIGSRTVKVDPTFSSLSTSTVPPCALTMCFTMERPSPVPPVSRERARSTR